MEIGIHMGRPLLSFGATLLLLVSIAFSGCISSDSTTTELRGDCRFSQLTGEEYFPGGQDYLVHPPESAPNWNADLTYCDFRNTNLTAEFMQGVNLSGSDLSGASLFLMYLSYVDLTDAEIVGADLRGIRMDESNLSGADLSDSNITGLRIHFTDLSHAKLTNAILTEIYMSDSSSLFEADLSGAQMQYGVIRDDMTYADLSNANLTGTDLSQAYITGVIWDNTICPDGTNSDNNGDTCENNLEPTEMEY
jgi:uncharacterized protein YjbI with pentapeptide repeats